MAMSETGRQFFFGNLWLIACCVFYLLWWILAFRPMNPVHGARTGWLLVPASVAGVVAVVMAVRAGSRAHVADALVSSRTLVLAGIVGYVVLLLVTWLAFKRPVTSELFLIVGWAVLALYEVDKLFGTGIFSHRQATGFIAAILIVLVICMICYTVYYRLGALPRYVVGAIPLTLGAVVMGVISYAIRHASFG